ncbi:type IV toxin-antitoxin system AbiEi family antitoxin domain-containing protein [uncultured Bacteroides sp.]|uniref:type IV toxin-antitoxin system AbiEi family antitoxin domain-containing protein n=1 Tax=uncultured Bacteroides sp. TaxID=162156 RepID=UPI0025E19BE0|nr:type IV toxin-antitoxin system AbiEi family antitoxin domain-containing protein [uncultured Bacteroides sp.]
MQNISEIVAAKGGVVTMDEITDRAEYKRILRAVERGELIRLRQGVYAVPIAILNTMIDVERIVPQGVLCLYSAWAYYQLTTTVPPSFCIAIEAKRKVKLPIRLPINLYYWKAGNLEFGIVDVEVSNYQVRMTDLERSVCDAVKYRNKIGLDLCAEIIRTYLRKKERNLSRLMDYAERLRVTKILNNYLEIAIE